MFNADNYKKREGQKKNLHYNYYYKLNNIVILKCKMMHVKNTISVYKGQILKESSVWYNIEYFFQTYLVQKEVDQVEQYYF